MLQKYFYALEKQKESTCRLRQHKKREKTDEIDFRCIFKKIKINTTSAMLQVLNHIGSRL